MANINFEKIMSQIKQTIENMNLKDKWSRVKQAIENMKLKDKWSKFKLKLDQIPIPKWMLVNVKKLFIAFIALMITISASVLFYVNSSNGNITKEDSINMAAPVEKLNSENGYEYIDLGLSVMWATCNVGANAPEEYGYYFAWGETHRKSDYTEKTYSYKGTRTTLPMSADAAAVNWGGSWRMPTNREQNELRTHCTWTWTTLNGVKGYRVTSKINGNSIFLPAAGYHSLMIQDRGYRGCYWSSSLNTTRTACAYTMNFKSSDVGSKDHYRDLGMSVRPVVSCNKQAAQNEINMRGTQEEKNTVQTFTVSGVSFSMVAVKGGTFTMGATVEQGSDADDKDDNERPTHSVTLSDFSIGETEVTQELWQAVMGNNPSCFQGTNFPVENVSWDDCQKFIKKLNKLTGKKFHLPTEAQWEYAARGGNKSKGYKYAGSNYLNSVGWFEGNSNSITHQVKRQKPNELGLYDMSGNVSEWCLDRYGFYSSSTQTNPTGSARGSKRVIRGGSWGGFAEYCRVSNRNYSDPAYYAEGLGLRLAL